MQHTVYTNRACPVDCASTERRAIKIPIVKSLAVERIAVIRRINPVIDASELNDGWAMSPYCRRREKKLTVRYMYVAVAAILKIVATRSYRGAACRELIPTW
jgi:hypothetical protein